MRPENVRQVLCECGMSYKSRDGYEKHFVDGLHKKVLYIRKALKDVRNSQMAIAKKLGISRERVRQLVKLIGLEPVRVRNRREALKRLLEKREVEPAWVHEVRLKLRKEGIEVQDWKQIVGKHRIVKVEGKVCALAHLLYKKGFETMHLHLWVPFPRDYEFVLGYSEEVGWFVFPAKLLEKKVATCFVWKKKERWPGAKKNEHRYVKCHRAWHLLRGGENEFI